MHDAHSPLIQLCNIGKSYFSRRGAIHAVRDISLNIYPGQTVGIIGESGSGKSTLGRIAIGLERPSSGQVLYQHHDLASASTTAWRSFRRSLQMIFQDPYSSLNPQKTVYDIIAEGLTIHCLQDKHKWKAHISALMDDVGLDITYLDRSPRQLSGGQRQRVAIARALAVNPSVVVCDEPTSALDTITQAKILRLFLDLKMKHKLTYLFISHDLYTIRSIADIVVVMHKGCIVECGETQSVFNTPQHPYTQELLNA